LSAAPLYDCFYGRPAEKFRAILLWQQEIGTVPTLDCELK